MKNTKIKQSGLGKPKELAMHFMSALVEVARESFLIVDSDLKVVFANPVFYRSFRVTPKKTEGVFLYDLGNGQWDIPKLRKLLEEILPRKKIVKDYEVTHTFETIGEKTILLNAKQLDSVQLITLAMEDITERKKAEQKIVNYAKELESKVEERTNKLNDQIKQLEALNKSMVGRELKMMTLKKEIESLKKLIKNGNGKNKNGKSRNGNHRNSR